MTYAAIHSQRPAARLRPAGGAGVWRFRLLMLASLALGACMTATPEPSRYTADQQLDGPQSFRNTGHMPATIPADALDFVPRAPSSVELDGTATIGGWKSRSSDIRGQVILATSEAALNKLFDDLAEDAQRLGAVGSPSIPALPLRSPPIADVSVAVESLRGDNSGMDRDMRHALKASEHPTIEYCFRRIQHASVEFLGQDHQPRLRLAIDGTLDMAGTRRDITMEVTIDRDSDRRFFMHAQTQMQMTDFGVTPPVALFGLIKAGDQVRVTFDLNVALRDLAADKQ